jgi:DMSO/TMAO reductase YedYZ molybdopterin-dependent catalytic subunit
MARALVPLMLLAAVALRAAGPALVVEGATGRDGALQPPLVLSMEQLAAMARSSVRVQTHDGGEHTYEGVTLAEILKRAGQPSGEDLRGKLLSRYVVVTAHDGYRAVFSLPELDPAFTDARVLVADRVDGKPLAAPEGPLRIVVPAEKRPARWVRMVEKIEILGAPEPSR